MKKALLSGLIAFGLLVAITPARSIAGKDEETLAMLCKRFDAANSNEVKTRESLLKIADRPDDKAWRSREQAILISLFQMRKVFCDK